MATLQYHHHAHDLKLGLVHEDCTRMTCWACSGQIQDSVYCCEECQLFLHKSCAELPNEIWRHPFHQQHRIFFGAFGKKNCDTCKCRVNLRFSCLDCGTTFCSICIAATMPDDGSLTWPVDDLTIQHFAHQHPLASCHIGMQSRTKCKLCENTISGEVYGCYECFLFMHKKCAESPQEVKHPFHPQHPLTLLTPGISDVSGKSRCDICYDRCCMSIYSCIQCEFNLGFRCAISTIEFPVSEDNGLFIDHFAHQHRLKYFHVKVKNQIPCKVCGENTSGEMYGCTDCLFFLHKSCTQLPLKIDHLLHEEHSSLALVPTSPNDFALRDCFSCHEWIRSYAFTFSCQECKFALDVKCALETLNFLNQGGSVQIEHHLHGHPLRLFYREDSNEIVEKCGGCEGSVQGLAYKCSSCDFLIHRSCAELPLEMRHPCHAQHKATLHSGTDYYACSVCFKYNTGIRFRCETCDFYSDISCAYRNLTFKLPLHEHRLSHFVEIRGFSPCKACGKTCSLDIYRCVQCNFNIHADCLPQLPPKIEHRSHLHQLTFADYFVEDDYGECYCDFCAKSRNPELGVYYCEECPKETTVTAHIACAVSGDIDLADKVRKILKVTERDPAIDRVDEQIASLQAQSDVLNKELDEINKKLDGINEELQCLKLKRAALVEVEELKKLQVGLPN